jgi:hypothetical protein
MDLAREEQYERIHCHIHRTRREAHIERPEAAQDFHSSGHVHREEVQHVRQPWAGTLRKRGVHSKYELDAVGRGVGTETLVLGDHNTAHYQALIDG